MTDRREQMRAACNAFHAEHPEVWDLFVKFTLEGISHGRKRFGVEAIWNRLRWETNVNPDYEDYDFKLNNNHKAFYARRFMRQFPEHDGYFATRESRAQSADG